MAEVIEIRELERLASYRLVWQALLNQTIDATFFQSLDWLETFWRHHPEQRFRVLMVESGGEPIGIVPLVVVTEKTGIGPVRFLTYPLQDWGSFYGPIGPNPAATLAAAMGYLRRARRDWDVLDLRWIDRDRTDRGRTKLAMRSAGFCPHEQPWMRGAVVDLPRNWRDYWQSRRKVWRTNVDRCRRRLEAEGRVAYLRCRPEGIAVGDGDPRWDLYDQCVAVAERSWQSRSAAGNTLSSAEVSEFLRGVHAAAARAGAVDLNLLLVDGSPCAFVYNYHREGRVFGLRKGFDPAFRAAAPGVVLDRLMFEDAVRRGDIRYDLGVGSLEVKRPWITREVTSYRMTHFPCTAARAQILRLKRWCQAHFGDTDALVAWRSA